MRVSVLHVPCLGVISSVPDVVAPFVESMLLFTEAKLIAPAAIGQLIGGENFGA